MENSRRPTDAEIAHEIEVAIAEAYYDHPDHDVEPIVTGRIDRYGRPVIALKIRNR